MEYIKWLAYTCVVSITAEIIDMVANLNKAKSSWQGKAKRKSKHACLGGRD